LASNVLNLGEISKEDLFAYLNESQYICESVWVYYEEQGAVRNNIATLKDEHIRNLPGRLLHLREVLQILTNKLRAVSKGALAAGIGGAVIGGASAYALHKGSERAH
jgi:hypothetical protein